MVRAMFGDDRPAVERDHSCDDEQQAAFHDAIAKRGYGAVRYRRGGEAR